MSDYSIGYEGRENICLYSGNYSNEDLDLDTF